MNIEDFRNYCISKKGVTENFPFDDKVLVFKVVNKMFALANIYDFESINLKCETEKAIALREKYDEVKPGYHMSKKHWNTVTVNASLKDEMVYQLIDHSYDLIIQKLTKKEEAQLLSS